MKAHRLGGNPSTLHHSHSHSHPHVHPIWDKWFVVLVDAWFVVCRPILYYDLGKAILRGGLVSVNQLSVTIGRSRMLVFLEPPNSGKKHLVQVKIEANERAFTIMPFVPTK